MVVKTLAGIQLAWFTYQAILLSHQSIVAPEQMEMPLLNTSLKTTHNAEHLPKNVSDNTLRKFNADRLAVRMENFPPMPAIGMEVVKLTENPDSNLADIESVLSRDPVLTARVFRMANSSFFSRGVISNSLREACSRLGLRTLRNVTVACCAGQVLNSESEHYSYQPQGLWVHSLYAALGSQFVAKTLGYDRNMQDEVFLSALVHDIGKLLLDPLIDRRIDGCGMLGIESEKNILGITHTEVGVSIMEQWKLPEYCRSVVAHHHHVDLVEEFDTQVALVHLTDWMLNQERIALLQECSIDSASNPAAAEILSLSVDDIVELQQTFRDNLDTLGACIVELQ